MHRLNLLWERAEGSGLRSEGQERMLGADYESPMGSREELKSSDTEESQVTGRGGLVAGTESDPQHCGRGSGAAGAFVEILWCQHCTGRKLAAGCHRKVAEFPRLVSICIKQVINLLWRAVGSIRSFSKHLLRAYCVLDSLLGAGDMSANKTEFLALGDS